jgi:septation ring formation regulator EzrA
MDDVYEVNAPADFPSPKEQPTLEQQPLGEEKKILLVKETVERWKKEILDKIQFMKENYDQAHRDKEGLMQEIDHLKEQLTATQSHAQALERKLGETLETFNNLLDEVSRALQG